jgi:hypothetical protein
MTVKMSEHGHAAVGVEITVTILPPGIEIEPIVTFAYMAEGADRISEHEHELLELPSLGISSQQLIGNQFSTHSHIMEGVSIGLGASTFTCACTPPPLPDDASKRSAFSTMRTKLCSQKQLISFLRNQLQQKIDRKIQGNTGG